jgi:hypothetical protein
MPFASEAALQDTATVLPEYIDEFAGEEREGVDGGVVSIINVLSEL